MVTVSAPGRSASGRRRSHRRGNTATASANLDTYGGNNGSAVFNASTGVVEGIVRGNADLWCRARATAATSPTSAPTRGARLETSARDGFSGAIPRWPAAPRTPSATTATVRSRSATRAPVARHAELLRRRRRLHQRRMPRARRSRGVLEPVHLVRRWNATVDFCDAVTGWLHAGRLRPGPVLPGGVASTRLPGA